MVGTAGETPLMLLSADLQELLSLPLENPSGPVGHADRVARDDGVQWGGATTRLQDGADLLNRRIALAQEWLEQAPMLDKLRDRGITRSDMLDQVQLQSVKVLRMLTLQSAEGMVVFPLVPSAHHLFTQAFIEADLAKAEPGRSLMLPRLGTLPRLEPDTVEPPKPYVNLVRQKAALVRLRQFERNYVMLMPQVRFHKLADLWPLAKGRVEFQTAEDVAANFPCAVSVSGGQDGVPLAPVYPHIPGGSGTQLEKAFIGFNEIVVSRAPGSASVQVSVDGYNWIRSRHYTDESVEAAKVEMWSRLLSHGRILYERVLTNSFWGYR